MNKITKIWFCSAIVLINIVLSVLGWFTLAESYYDIRIFIIPVSVTIFFYALVSVIKWVMTRRMTKVRYLFLGFFVCFIVFVLICPKVSRQSDFSKRLQEQWQLRHIAHLLEWYHDEEHCFPPFQNRQGDRNSDSSTTGKNWRRTLIDKSELPLSELPGIFTSPFDRNEKGQDIKTRYKTVFISVTEKQYFIVFRDWSVSTLSADDDLSFDQFKKVVDSVPNDIFPGYFKRPTNNSAMILFSDGNEYLLSLKGLLKVLEKSNYSINLQKSIKEEQEHEMIFNQKITILFRYIFVTFYVMLFLLISSHIFLSGQKDIDTQYGSKTASLSPSS